MYMRFIRLCLLSMAVFRVAFGQTVIYGCEEYPLWVEVQGRQLCLSPLRGDGQGAITTWNIFDLTRRMLLPDLKLPASSGTLSITADSVEWAKESRDPEDSESGRILHYGLPLEELLLPKRTWVKRGELGTVNWRCYVHPLDERHLLVWNMGGIPSLGDRERTLWGILKRNPEGKYLPFRSGDHPDLPPTFITDGTGRRISRHPGITNSPMMITSTQAHVALCAPFQGRMLIFNRTKLDLERGLRLSDAVPDQQDRVSVAFPPVYTMKAAPDGAFLVAMRTDEAILASISFLKNRKAAVEAGLKREEDENFQKLHPQVKWMRLGLEPYSLKEVHLPGAPSLTAKGESETVWSICWTLPWTDGTLLKDAQDIPAVIEKQLNKERGTPSPLIAPEKAEAKKEDVR